MKFFVEFERDDYGEWTASMPDHAGLPRHGMTIGIAVQKLFEAWIIGALRETKQHRASGATTTASTDREARTARVSEH
jgi:hypothetical protein